MGGFLLLFSSTYIITQSYEKVKHIGQCVGENVMERDLVACWRCYGIVDNRCYKKGANVQFLRVVCNIRENITNQQRRGLGEEKGCNVIML